MANNKKSKIVGYMGYGMFYCASCMHEDMDHELAIIEGYDAILEGTEFDEVPECEDCGEEIEGIVVPEEEEKIDDDEPEY